MKVSKHELDENQIALLRALGAGLGKPWINGLEVTARYLDVKVIRPYHLVKINEMIALSRGLRELGLIDARENPKVELFNWDLRITSAGKKHIGSRRMFPGMLGAAMAVTACSSFSPAKPPGSDLPPKATIPYRQVVGVPSMVQIRDESGVVAWRYCNEDCPRPTPKHLTTATVEVPVRPAGAEGKSVQAESTGAAAQNLQDSVKQALVAAIQKPSPSAQPASTTIRTLNYSVFFNMGSATLTKDGREAIRDLAPDLMRAESINIVGRADPIGSAVTNERLSKARGEAVRAELIKEGVSTSKIELGSKIEVAQLDAKTTMLNKQPAALHDQSRRTDMSVDLLVLRGR